MTRYIFFTYITYTTRKYYNGKDLFFVNRKIWFCALPLSDPTSFIAIPNEKCKCSVLFMRMTFYRLCE